MKNIIIVNKEKFEELKKKFKKGGKDKIHVLSDFDRTFTMAFYKSKNASAIIQLLRKKKGRYLSEDYFDKAHALFDKYHPIEIDPNIPEKEKEKEMYKWWKAHNDLLVESGFNLEIKEKCIKDAIKEKSLSFRSGVKDFFKILNKKDIPLVIMTSSLGDLAEEYIKQNNLLTKNIEVIGNGFEFNEEGKAIGVKRIIHSFNKNEFSTEGLKIHKKLLNRKNVILLGDTLGDLEMVIGFDYDDIIKIGFLNERVEERLESFKKGYDVLILNDGNFDFVNKLIKEIL